jgi:peptide-methionine (R)-S-oxide reductase
MRWEILVCLVLAVSAFLAGTRESGSKAVQPTAQQQAVKSKSPDQKREKMLTWDSLKPEEKSPVREDKLVLTDAEWKAKLTAEQYRILRSHGTDPAFCGLMENQTEEGDYHCAGCDLPLFVSSNKFISKSGWPSFYIPVKRENIWMRTDSSYGMVRVEVLCSKCDGHLGHVFPDGPAPSGLRFCINGSALTFKKSKD